MTQIRSPFDVEIGRRADTSPTRQGYMLAASSDSPSITIELQNQSVPQVEDEQVQVGTIPGEVSVTWDDWSRGMGYEYPARKRGFYAWSKGVWAGQPGLLTLPPDITAIAYPGGSTPNSALGWFFVDNDKVYLSNDRLYVSTLGSSSLTLEDTHTGIPQSMVRFAGRYYVGSTNTTFRTKPVSSGSWADGPAQVGRHFTVVGNRLYTVSDVEVVSFTTDDGLQLADWEGAFTTGDVGAETRRLLASGLLLFIAKKDGLYGMDTLGNIFPIIRTIQANESMWGAEAEGALVYLPSKSGLTQYEVNGLRDNIFFFPQLRERQIADYPVAASVSENGNVYIAANIRDTAGTGVNGYHILVYNPKQRSMHSLYHTYVASGQVGAIKWAMGSDADAWVYWISDQAASTPRLVMLPSPEPLTYWKREQALTFSGTKQIAMSMHDAGFPGMLKDWQSVEIVHEQLSEDNQIDVYYRLSLNDSWTLLGSVTVGANNERGHTFLTFSDITSEYLQLRLDLTADNNGAANSTSPLVPRMVLRATVMPLRHPILTLRIKLDDQIVNRDGVEDRRTAQVISSDLIALFRGSEGIVGSITKPSSLVDLVWPDGTVHVCQPLSYEEQYQQSRIVGAAPADEPRMSRVAVLRLLSISSDYGTADDPA